MSNIYLIGMMNCGKSTCARLLSQRLGRPWLDTDQTIEARQRQSVSDIFAQRGEDCFRDLETALCRELSERQDLIVACGGGLPLRRENRALLRESGTVVFLNRDPERCYDSGDMSGRPLAQAGREAFLQRFARREPLYRAAAHIIIGDHPTAEAAVEALLKELEVQP